MKKVLITGATGFIGYYLLKELYRNSVECWIVCRDGCRELEKLKTISGIHIIMCDLNCIEKLPDICDEREFDAFYHLAWDGASGPLRSDANLQMDNAKWTMECVAVASQMKCKKLIVTGTICEKQCESIGNYPEFLKSSFYLLGKKYSHVMAQNMCKKLGQPIVWCYFYHPVGVFNKKEQIITNTIKKLMENGNLEFGSGQGLFDVIDVVDLAVALYLMGEKDLKHDTYYVGSGCPRKLKEYLEIVRDKVNPGACLHFGNLNLGSLPMKYEWLDTSEFENATGFRTTIVFEESIDQVKAWLSNPQKYEEKKWKFDK